MQHILPGGMHVLVSSGGECLDLISSAGAKLLNAESSSVMQDLLGPQHNFFQGLKHQGVSSLGSISSHVDS